MHKTGFQQSGFNPWILSGLEASEMTVKASEHGNVSEDGFMSTSATLSTNGLLTIETYSKTSARTEGLGGHVVVVVYDGNGNAIRVSKDHRCTTRCATWDPSCPSSGTDSWFEEFPEVIGRFAASLDIVHDNRSLGDMVEKINRAIKESKSIAEEIRNPVS
jgi:hypothetical protein